MTKTQERILAKLSVHLLAAKTWRYLRYLHAREALRLAAGTRSVLVVGCGPGLAELALAVEYPNVRFHLTDYDAATHDIERAIEYAKVFGIDNVSFGVLNILSPQDVQKFDMVYSVEVLEHIEDDRGAAENMKILSNKYVFCLVPFAEPAKNSDPASRSRVLRQFEHHVMGYDVRTLVNLFPDPISIRGCYWADAGRVFREKLSGMTVDDVRATAPQLAKEAAEDIRYILPTSMKQALGVWVLSHV